MSTGVEDDKVTGILVDVNMKKGTMMIEVEGEIYECLWPAEFEAEIGDEVTVTMEDILNA
ncbi:MAG: hypothetical protein U0166_18960 [Acidobacteriota bacterium]